MRVPAWAGNGARELKPGDDGYEMPADRYEADGWYWEAVDDRDLRWHRPRRCCWCRRIHGHHPICRQQQDEWSIKMPWGKHKGRPLKLVPRSYVNWMAKNCDALDEDLRNEMMRLYPELEFVLQRRF